MALARQRRRLWLQLQRLFTISAYAQPMTNWNAPRPHICRLFVLIARDARTAVIFRHGPRKYTRLIRWDMATDHIEAGQWFKGSIFDRFADLSPTGNFLIYYASKHGGTPEAWTAISQPPYFTALALWPQARTESGGGLFETENKVLLNHREGETCLMDGFRLRNGLTIERRDWEAHRGTDLYHVRLLRDGWTLLDAESGFAITSKRWPIYEKSSRFSVRLWMRLCRRRGKDEVDYEVVLPNNSVWQTWPCMDWVDFDQNGDLLLSKRGCIWRIPRNEIGTPEVAPRHIADFSDMQFEAIKAPPAASHWPYRTRP